MPEHAPARAKQLDAALERQADSIRLPAFRELVAHIRVYLLRQNATIGARNNVHQILKTAMNGNVGSMTVGPQFDKGPTDSHFYTRSGARLSFGVTVREHNGRCSLVAYRFHLHVASDSSPVFYRFDLNHQAHPDPLREPCSHFHPGRDDIRLPCPVLSPIEVLDRIFYAIDVVF